MEELIRKIPTTIDGNDLKGDKGTPDQPGYEIITGTIGDDGNAKLDVNGVLANRANAHGLFAHKGEDYHYTVKAHFDADKGTGTRDTGLGIESRPCNFTFERQPAGAAPPPPRHSNRRKSESGIQGSGWPPLSSPVFRLTAVQLNAPSLKAFR